MGSKEYWNLVETGITAAAERTDLSEAQKKAIDEQKVERSKGYELLVPSH